MFALTHAAQGMKGVNNIAEFIDPNLVPTSKVRLAAFDGENADPVNGRPIGDGFHPALMDLLTDKISTAIYV